jgi:hypothetical protein
MVLEKNGGFNVLGNAVLLVVFLDISLGHLLFFHDANEACNLPSNAIADAAAATAIRRRGADERRVRRTADQIAARYQSLN